MSRIAIVCPGRGSYTEKTLRSLPDEHALVRRADELRAQYGRTSLVELDRAAKFSQALHLAPADVSPLIWLVTMLDAAAATAEHECVAVAGNSMGWYTALAVGGALSFDDGFRLVQEMSLLQQELGRGGQILYPLVDEQWRRDPKLAAEVRAALESSHGQAFPSIDLGGFAVLAGSEEGVAHLARALRPIRVGVSSYPFRLVQHAAYHTPLARPVAERALAQLRQLDFRAPRVTLVDGRGARFTPWSTDVDELATYTLTTQVVEPYDFATSVRVVLREHAPDHLVLPGPGNSLGGVCGQILSLEGWRALHSRADFDLAQRSATPPVLSLRR